jgi:hypothetical protein
VYQAFVTADLAARVAGFAFRSKEAKPMKRTTSILTIAACLMLTAIIPASAAELGAWPWQLSEFPWQTGGVVHVPPGPHP